MPEVLWSEGDPSLRHFYELNPGLVVDLRKRLLQVAPELGTVFPERSPLPTPAPVPIVPGPLAPKLQPPNALGQRLQPPQLPIVYLNEMPLLVESAFSGSATADSLIGTNGSDMIAGGRGRDTLMGLGGVDVLSGEDGQDTLYGNQGSDRLLGGNGDDSLYGGAGADNLQGGAGSDRLLGGNGDDSLRGDAGFDTLVGNAGRDVFVLQPLAGTDTIQDFVDGEDKIGLMDLRFEAIAILQVGSNTVIRTHQHDLAVLSNVSAASLTIEDFVQVAIAW